MTPTQITALIQLALSQVGVREVGDNGGAMVAAYQRVTGNNPGDSWCASFVAWLVFAISGPLHSPVLFSGSAEEQRQNHFKSGRKLTHPVAGCQGFVVNRATDHARHTFLVTTNVDTNGCFWTVEGNTNDDGSSNGLGVFHRLRQVNTQYDFATLQEVAA